MISSENNNDSATERFSPSDMEQASVCFEAMCGHGALAAALGKSVCDVMVYFGRGGWVNIPMMESAIRKAGKSFVWLPGWSGNGLPGVTMVQFLGSWMNPEVPVAARCRYRHWVAVEGGQIWDCNAGLWQDRQTWENEIIPQLMPKRGTGFSALRTLFWPAPKAY